MPDGDSSQPGSGLVLFRPEDGGRAVRVLVEGESVWLTQRQIAELFQTTPQNITMHLKGVYREGELEEEATCKRFLQVGLEGGERLDAFMEFKDRNETACVTTDSLGSRQHHSRQS